MIVRSTRWRKLCGVEGGALAEGQLLRVELKGQALCLTRINGSLHALSDVCPHQGRSISGGWCDEGHVVCPWHRFHFDPATGKARNGICSDIPVFPLEQRKDGLYIGLPRTTFRILGFDLW
jgi:nitrite reductase/ring-hydroxylating ferredoxin subunit